MEKVKSYQTKSVKALKEMYSNYTPKSKYSDLIILELLKQLEDNTKIIAEETRQDSNVLNRGSVVECLVRAYIRDQHQAKKSTCNGSDLRVNGVKFEIKFATSFANASYSGCKNEEEYVIFLNQTGIYISKMKYRVLDKSQKHIKDFSNKTLISKYYNLALLNKALIQLTK